MANWLYIAGRGHSGSTMLDAMLGNAEGIESVGEFVAGIAQPRDKCSCGQSFEACPYWTEVRTRFEGETGRPWAEAAGAAIEQAHLFKLPRTILSPRSSAWARNVAGLSSAMADAISARSPYVVDSSKEVTRALFLLKHDSGAKVIHLVRHPASVLESHYRRLRSGKGFKFLRMRFYPKHGFALPLLTASLGWLVGNALLGLGRLVGPGRMMRVRYEDLLRDPIATVARIERFLGEDLAAVKRKLEADEPFEVGHNIGGNQMRMAGSFRFDRANIREPDLPRGYRIMVSAICFPLLAAYGYLGNGPAPLSRPQPPAIG